MDIDARIQLFDLKTKYMFQTQPGVDQYNMPLYDVQSETPNDVTSQDIWFLPVYQGFMDPCYINGYRASFTTLKTGFFDLYPNVVQQQFTVGTGNGGVGPYTLSFPVTPVNAVPVNPPVQAILRGHVDINGIIAAASYTGINQDPIFGSDLAKDGAGNVVVPSTCMYPAVYITSTDINGNNVIVQDSGQFLKESGANMANYGLLMTPGTAPFGYSSLPNGGSLPTSYTTTQNTINYLTGVATNVYFPVAIPDGVNINAQCFYFQTGLPRQVLFYNNVITLRSPPDTQYLVELDAYLSPAAFFSTTQAIPFAYMSEYIARGAARKILSDTGDAEQLAFYEPLFKEQEMLVWKRSQRQFTASRTPTIYSQGMNNGQSGGYNYGGLGTP